MRVRKEEERVIYIEPEMEVIEFNKTDVVTGSMDNKPEGEPDIKW